MTRFSRLKERIRTRLHESAERRKAEREERREVEAAGERARKAAYREGFVKGATKRGAREGHEAGLHGRGSRLGSIGAGLTRAQGIVSKYGPDTEKIGQSFLGTSEAGGVNPALSRELGFGSGGSRRKGKKRHEEDFGGIAF